MQPLYFVKCPTQNSQVDRPMANGTLLLKIKIHSFIHFISHIWMTTSWPPGGVVVITWSYNATHISHCAFTAWLKPWYLLLICESCLHMKLKYIVRWLSIGLKLCFYSKLNVSCHGFLYQWRAVIRNYMTSKSLALGQKCSFLGLWVLITATLLWN